MIPTIKVKFLVGFFIIFSVSLLLLNHFVVQIIETSNEKIITQDLVSLKKNSSVYVKQTFMINHYNNDEIYFQQMAKEMVEDLHHVSSSEVSAYTVSGDRIYTSNDQKFMSGIDEDLKNALNGKTAYTIYYTNSAAEVYYSYPVVMDGKKVGILRFAKDFSLLHEQSKHILDFIYYVTIAIFAVAFIFSYILSRNITIPIIKLTQASTEVTNGNLNIRIAFKRKDEIGKLANNFSKMIEKIKMQIGKIENDRDRLEELNRHRKQFYDNVTHELKTPLTSILGYAEMIQENGQDDKVFFDKGMNHIVDESKRLHEMVVNLLELSKETTAQEAFECIEAGRILQDVCEGMSFKAERYKKTIQSTVEESLYVYGNADKLRQVFINVIDNAIKYGYSQSDILVQAHFLHGFVQITIINKGEEMKSEDLINVFEPFYRVDRRLSKETGSRGLGLSICKAIVIEHGGSIHIMSENQETSVHIQLPYRVLKRDPV
ncbi:sensor histidine kinase [Paenibacillus radicis (ex Xue et al. 2023)]|uniref:histidine kinase n=1 Tax=Paenibacillus radicis (ex Xue et al. 2023) TaxID=2972489 RepID=A0ABT1YF09_9BACL|nr:HAMP domain-containing sensor histidine kinase [Paenibacillus radicis (ex Xue et al. 2023)]MCR8631788.1 HAMP domain-containing histidine kinase [Paenibacillus radicis (ex Xue et al. 2023)]